MPAKSASKPAQKAAAQQQKAQPAKAAPSPAKAAVQPVQQQKQAQQTSQKPTPKQEKVQESPKQSQVSTAAPAPKAPLVKRASLTPSQQVEQQQILNVLLDDAGKDWKPRDKTPKQPVQKPAAKQNKQPVKQAPPAQKAQTAAAQKAPAQKAPAQKAPATAQKASAQKAPAQAAKPATAPALVKRASLTQVQQAEQQQILNILVDDAGKDWKPRDKTPKQPVPKHTAKQKKQSQKAPVKQQAQKAAVKQPAPAQTAPKPAALVKRASLTQTQQAEQQQILNILLDDAGKDWKPRNKTAPKQPFKKPAGHKAKASQKKPTSAPAKAVAVQPVQQAPKPALLTRRSSLTDAQKKEKREIMEILLDPYVFVPARVIRRGSATQAKAELHKVGNAVVVSNPAVGPNEDLSGFETVKSRRTSVKEKKDLRTEQDAILSVLVDFKEPAKKTQKGKQPQPKAQSAHQQKAQPVKHITSKANQGRAKLAT